MIKTKIINLFVRLFGDSSIVEICDNGNKQANEITKSGSETIFDKLKDEIKKLNQTECNVYSNSKHNEFDKNIFEKKLELFLQSGKITMNINFLIEALETISPTFIESERTFSTVGLFL